MIGRCAPAARAYSACCRCVEWPGERREAAVTVLEGSAPVFFGLSARRLLRRAAMGNGRFVQDGTLRHGAFCLGCAGKTAGEFQTRGAGNGKRHFFSRLY